MIGITTEKNFNVTTKETNTDIYLRLYLSAFKSGLVAELKPTNFTVLLAICSFMNDKGECYPTQEQIAELTGISKPTVNKAVNELVEFKVNGKPLVGRTLIQKGYHKSSIYTVNPISQVAIFDGEIDTNLSTNTGTNVETKIETINDVKYRTAKDVSTRFTTIYNTVYGVNPNINFARDLSLVKKKWIGHFTDVQIDRMLETGVREYDARWKNGKFPRPSLSALVSWIGEQALGLSEDADKEYKEAEALTSNGNEMNDVAINRLANRLKK